MIADEFTEHVCGEGLPCPQCERGRRLDTVWRAYMRSWSLEALMGAARDLGAWSVANAAPTRGVALAAKRHFDEAGQEWGCHLHRCLSTQVGEEPLVAFPMRE